MEMRRPAPATGAPVMAPAEPETPAAEPDDAAAAADHDVPVPVPAPTVVREDAPAEPYVEPKLRPQVGSLDIEAMLGLTPEEIEAAIGAPDDVSREAPTISWRYAEGPCTLDFQFFQDLETGLFRSLKYEVKGASANGCLARLERRMDKAAE